MPAVLLLLFLARKEADHGSISCRVSMHGVLSHLNFEDMEGILLGESP